MRPEQFDKPTEERAWYPLYEAWKDKPYGYVATYTEIMHLLEVDTLVDRQPIYRARKEMLRNDHKTMKNVPRVGYRVILPNEHVNEARDRRKYAARHLVKARDLLQYVNRCELTSQEMEAHTKQELLNSRAVQAARMRSVKGMSVQPAFDTTASLAADAEARKSRVAMA